MVRRRYRCAAVVLVAVFVGGLGSLAAPAGAAPAGAAPAGAAPAGAAAAGDGLTMHNRSYQCNSHVAGLRFGSWVVASVLDVPGTLTAFSITPASVVTSGSHVGEEVRGNHTVGAQFEDESGVDSVTLRLTVHFDGRTDGGPADVSLTDTIQLPDCRPDPRLVRAVNRCDGRVELVTTNGVLNDFTSAGGIVFWEVTGAHGWRSGFQQSAGYGEGSIFVPKESASAWTLTGNGVSIAQGAYTPSPGCYGSTPDDDSGGGSTGGSTGTGGASSGGGAGPPPATSEPSPSPSDAPAPSMSPAPAASTVDTVASSQSGPVGPRRWYWVVIALVIAAVIVGAAHSLRRGWLARPGWWRGDT